MAKKKDPNCPWEFEMDHRKPLTLEEINNGLEMCSLDEESYYKYPEDIQATATWLAPRALWELRQLRMKEQEGK